MGKYLKILGYSTAGLFILSAAAVAFYVLTRKSTDTSAPPSSVPTPSLFTPPEVVRELTTIKELETRYITQKTRTYTPTPDTAIIAGTTAGDIRTALRTPKPGGVAGILARDPTAKIVGDKVFGSGIPASRYISQADVAKQAAATAAGFESQAVDKTKTFYSTGLALNKAVDEYKAKHTYPQTIFGASSYVNLLGVPVRVPGTIGSPTPKYTAPRAIAPPTTTQLSRSISLRRRR